MSRLGKKILALPAGTEVKTDNGKVNIKGPKGSLEVLLPKSVVIEIKDQALAVKGTKEQSALWGLTWACLRNALDGVSKGFEKKLEINGVGYRALVQGKKLVLNIGFTRPEEVVAPEGIAFEVKENIITVSGIDRQKVGQLAAEIREKRAPEPYKGKGIKYVGEQIRRKAGKKAAASE